MTDWVAIALGLALGFAGIAAALFFAFAAENRPRHRKERLAKPSGEPVEPRYSIGERDGD
jgi:hypothetical protein